MKMRVFPSVPDGNIKAIASKSAAHRLLICASFANAPTRIMCEESNRDIEATAACLAALGAGVVRNAPYYDVTPIDIANIKKNALLPCGESGSTLRFLLPVVAALGAGSTFIMEGRLPLRPLSPLDDELDAHGVTLKKVDNRLTVCGRLSGDRFCIAGNVSSQFISGLLFALSLLPYPATLNVTGSIESAPYINITTDALALFGRAPRRTENIFAQTPSKFISPSFVNVEGDWSNAAFMLALGAIGNGSVHMHGLNSSSAQGDMAIVELLIRLGANIKNDGENYSAVASSLHGIDIDASQIPDLVPIFATLASVAKGRTHIYGASRLRLKESDRLESVCEMLTALGANIQTTDDGLIINGVPRLSGGCVSSANDHRIAMSAAVAACACASEVVIEGAEAVSKSYPAFWDDIASLGIKIEKIDNN